MCIRDRFDISRVGRIAGCFITDGLVGRSHIAIVKRAGEEIFEGKITTLKRFKDDVKEVRKDYECGIAIEGFNEIEVGDIIETYALEEVART